MRSVLLVVQDEQLRASIGPLLSEIGYSVAATGSASDALREDAGQAAEVVLLDVSATDVEERVKDIPTIRAQTDAPIVLLMPHLNASLTSATARPDVAGHVLKPVDRRELEAALDLAVYRRAAEKHAAARERWYKSTLRCIVDGVITADEEAKVTFMNPAAEQLTGYSEAEALGRPLDAIFDVGPDVADRPVTPLDNSWPVLRLTNKAGTGLTVEHNSAPIVEDNGALHGVIVVFRDVTERRRSEQRLAMSDRMASIGTLAAGIAHELNNPLAFVTSNLEFAIGELERLQVDVEARAAAWAKESVGDAVEALREARDGASRAASIVKDMKVFMRADADPALLVDVNRAVSLALRLTNNEIRHNAELVTELGAVPPVFADEGKLVQVLVNVLTNAVQALDDKPGHKIEVSTVASDGRVSIRIRDTGRGIAPEHVERVFEPFFTTKAVGEGVGLGLSIAHTIITSFGGTVSVSSNVGVGTLLTISLPTAEAARATEKVAVAAAKEARGRVLVVDDEALIGTAIRRILAKQGMDVVVESQGKVALDRLSGGEHFDVVLCDLMMPGFSGVDLYEALDTAAPTMKSRVVFMTGNAFTPRAHALFEGTGNVRLEKPFVPNDLTKAIAEVLRRHGAKSAAG